MSIRVFIPDLFNDYSEFGKKKVRLSNFPRFYFSNAEKDLRCGDVTSSFPGSPTFIEGTSRLTQEDSGLFFRRRRLTDLLRSNA